MANFYRGYNQRSFASSKQHGAAPSLPKKTGFLHAESLDRRDLSAVTVSQEGGYIVIAGRDLAGRVVVTHRQGNLRHPYDDQIVVTWTSGGVSESRAFDLYKYVLQGDQLQPVPNVHSLELHDKKGAEAYCCQTSLSSYLAGGNADGDDNDEHSAGNQLLPFQRGVRSAELGLRIA